MNEKKICPLSMSCTADIPLAPCQEQDCAWWSNSGRCVVADIAQQLTRNRDCLDATLDSVEEAVSRI